jgi:hypothetical protein
MTLGFIPSDAAILIVQAACVAAPRRPPRPAWMERLSGPAWALVPIASIVGCIFAITYVSNTANGLTWLALIAVPLLAAVALGWAAHGARPWLALLMLPMFALAWFDRHTLLGQGSATLLCALSCVTLGWLLAAVTPPGWLKLGIVGMAVADSWLVLTDLLQTPNNTLVTAVVLPHSGLHLPQLQSETFGSINMGYGDLFVAGVFGGVLAREGRSQGVPALLTLFVAGLFDLLFFVLSELPATVPVALTMVALEARRWHTGAATPPWRWRPSWGRARSAPDAAQWGVSPPVEAGGRDSSAREVIASWPRAAPSSTSVASSAERE